MTRLRIGTRGSQLALWQARAVARLIEDRGGGAELVTIKTSGDRLQDAPLSEAGGKRLFVKEIEDALLGGEIDLAVHSAKDMSAVLPEGLTVPAALTREDPRDAIVLAAGASLPDLQAAVAALGDAPAIGTGSVRRIAQLATVLPSARFSPIRGNVDTRLRKLDAGEYDALVLASAGMRRLGFASRISAPIPVELCVPAPGQGIVAIETRHDDRETNARLAAIGDPRAGAGARSGTNAGRRARRRLSVAAGGRRAARRRRPRHARGGGVSRRTPASETSRAWSGAPGFAVGPAPGRRARRGGRARVAGGGTMTVTLRAMMLPTFPC